MNLPQQTSNQPNILSLDQHSRAKNHRISTEFQRALEYHGLCVRNQIVQPVDQEHQENWLNAIRAVRNGQPAKLVIVRSPPNLRCAYVSKNQSTNQIIVRTPIRRACDSATIDELSDLLGITPREREVLLLLASGYEPKTISRIMGTTTSTVKTQIKSICVKTGTNGMRDIIVLLSGLSEMRAA